MPPVSLNRGSASDPTPPSDATANPAPPPSSAPAAGSPTAAPAPHEPSQLEEELIHFFVQLASSVSIPKSVGELFGTLFCAEEALPFEEIVARTGMSKGSTSQGLRFLQKIKAVSTVYVARDRRTFYQAETSLRRLAGGILNETVRPRLETNEELIEEIEHLFDNGGGNGNGGEEPPAFLGERIHSLKTWNRKAKRLLPWVIRLTGSRTRDRESDRDHDSGSP